MPIANGAGGYQVGNGNLDEVQFSPQAAPVAYTGTTVTLAASDLVNGLITSTNASAVGFTLPTAALMDAAEPNVSNNGAFEFVIINLGSASGAVTLNAGSGFTVVGSATVAISTSGRYRARKVADGSWVAYRV
jgi:hypothetical protein